jgi:hypothetical protein
LLSTILKSLGTMANMPYRESHSGLAKSAWAISHHQIPESRLGGAPAIEGKLVYHWKNEQQP